MSIVIEKKIPVIPNCFRSSLQRSEVFFTFLSNENWQFTVSPCKIEKLQWLQNLFRNQPILMNIEIFLSKAPTNHLIKYLFENKIFTKKACQPTVAGRHVCLGILSEAVLFMPFIARRLYPITGGRVRKALAQSYKCRLWRPTFEPIMFVWVGWLNLVIISLMSISSTLNTN